MQKNKIKLILTSLLLVNSTAQAIDVQSKFRNTDRSLFETISDYQTIEPGRFYFSNTASLTSNPMVDPRNGKVLLNSLRDAEFSAVGAFTKWWEIGISVPYSQTQAVSGSGLNSFTGTGDIYIENKIRVTKSFSLVPVYIFQSGDGLVGAGSAEGGFGLKGVGGFNEDRSLPVYYSLGYYSLPNTTFATIDQSQRIQASVGTLYRLTKEIMAGGEFVIDHAKNRSSKEFLAHTTVHLDGFSVRAGVGSGFLNSDRLNNLRVFASLLFDLDFRSKEQTRLIKVTAPQKNMEAEVVSEEVSQEETKAQVKEDVKIEATPIPVPLDEEMNSQEEPSEELDEEDERIQRKIKEIEELQKKLKTTQVTHWHSNILLASNEELDSKFLVDNSLLSGDNSAEDDITVIPAYTVKNLRDLKQKYIKISDTTFEDTLKDKNTRLKSAQENLTYWIGEARLESKRKQAKVELSWGLRVIERRRNTLKDLYAKHQNEMDSLKDGLYFKEIHPNEVKAKEILKDNSLIAEKGKEEKISHMPVSKTIPQRKSAPQESEEARVERLKAEQQKAWNNSKNKTLHETLAARRGKKPTTTPILKAPETSKHFVDNSLAVIEEPLVVKEEVKPLIKEEPVVVKEDKKEEIKTLEVTPAVNQVVTPTVATVVQEAIPSKEEVKKEVVSVETVNISSSPKVEAKINKETPKETPAVVVVSPKSSLVSKKEATKPEAETPVKEAQQETKEETAPVVVVVPPVESLISEDVVIKNDTKAKSNVQDTLDKINYLVKKKKDEEKAEQESKYAKLKEYYEKELAEIKAKLEAEKKINEKPIPALEVETKTKTETNFRPDGTIEIKSFKINSIKERYQAEQEVFSAPKEQESNSNPRNFQGGLVEEGEIEVSDGPAY